MNKNKNILKELYKKDILNKLIFDTLPFVKIINTTGIIDALMKAGIQREVARAYMYALISPDKDSLKRVLLDRLNRYHAGSFLNSGVK